MPIIYIQPFVSLIETIGKKDASVKNSFAKVRRIVRTYAEERGQDISELVVLDFCDERNSLALSSVFSAFLDKSLNIRYKQETIARVHKILRAVFTLSMSGSEKAQTPKETIPEFLLPLLPALSRNVAYSERPGWRVSSWRLNSARRLNLPISDRGQRVLKTLLAVVNEFDVTDLESLFTKYNLETRKKIIISDF